MDGGSRVKINKKVDYSPSEEKIMGFKIVDKTLIILNIQNDQDWWSKKLNYDEEVRSVSMQIVELDDSEYNLLKPFEKTSTHKTFLSLIIIIVPSV